VVFTFHLSNTVHVVHPTYAKLFGILNGWRKNE